MRNSKGKRLRGHRARHREIARRLKVARGKANLTDKVLERAHFYFNRFGNYVRYVSPSWMQFIGAEWKRRRAA